MSIPQSVKQKAEQADQQIAEMARQRQQSEGAPAEEAQEPVTDQGAEQVTEVTDGAAEEVPTGEEGGDQTPSADDGSDWQSEAELWEQRYRSLDGMIRARDKQIEQLHTLLANMQAAPQQQEQEQQAQPTPAESQITKEDEREFGSDLVDMVRRCTRDEFRHLIEPIQQSLRSIQDEVKGVATTTQQTVQESFETKLDRMAPKWRTLDSDPAFMEWLKSNNARQQVFAQAVTKRDAATVADFFNEFAAQNQAPPDTRQDKLQKSVAPGKGRSAPAPAASQKEQKVWTRSEIADFYQSRRHLAADEFARKEREIAKAMQEGRVDYTR